MIQIIIKKDFNLLLRIMKIKQGKIYFTEKYVIKAGTISHKIPLIRKKRNPATPNLLSQFDIFNALNVQLFHKF